MKMDKDKESIKTLDDEIEEVNNKYDEVRESIDCAYDGSDKLELYASARKELDLIFDSYLDVLSKAMKAEDYGNIIEIKKKLGQVSITKKRFDNQIDSMNEEAETSGIALKEREYIYRDFDALENSIRQDYAAELEKLPKQMDDYRLSDKYKLADIEFKIALEIFDQTKFFGAKNRIESNEYEIIDFYNNMLDRLGIAWHHCANFAKIIYDKSEYGEMLDDAVNKQLKETKSHIAQIEHMKISVTNEINKIKGAY